MDWDGRLLLRQATGTLGFSAGAYDKILKVARTIADLDGAERIVSHHISEVHPPAVWRAINCRTLERRRE